MTHELLDDSASTRLKSRDRILDMNFPSAFPDWAVSAMQSQRLETAIALPAQLYSDPQCHDFERGLLTRSWQLMAHQNQLQEPGTVLPFTFHDAPTFLVRDQNDIRGFHNVCRHRGGPLVTACTRIKTLQCRYHGWTYHLDGRLKNAPEMEKALTFDPQQVALKQIHVKTWNGLIFASLDEAEISIDERIAGLTERLGSDLGTYQHHQQVTYEIPCNWKVYVENYLEGYHLPYVHPGLNKELSYADYKVDTQKWYSYQSSPISGETYADGTAHYVFIYPNMMLNLLPGRLQTNLVVPTAPNHCRVIFDYYYPNTATAESKKADLDFSEQVQQEDIDICSKVQKGLGSGYYTPGRLCPSQEKAVWDFQEKLRDAYRNQR